MPPADFFGDRLRHDLLMFDQISYDRLMIHFGMLPDRLCDKHPCHVMYLMRMFAGKASRLLFADGVTQCCFEKHP